MLLVLPVALFSGLMPGGGLPVSVVVLSLAVHLDPWVAITIVVFHMAASDITEPIPAILFGVPGARSAQATVLDGYPMAQQGLAGVALGASYTTTIVGGRHRRHRALAGAAGEPAACWSGSARRSSSC